MEVRSSPVVLADSTLTSNGKNERTALLCFFYHFVHENSQLERVTFKLIHLSIEADVQIHRDAETMIDSSISFKHAQIQRSIHRQRGDVLLSMEFSTPL